MIISTKKGTPKEELEKIVDKFEKQGLDVTLITGKDYNVFGLVGDTTKIDERDVLANPWIDNVTRVSAPYKRANRLFHPADSVIDCGGVKIGSILAEKHTYHLIQCSRRIVHIIEHLLLHLFFLGHHGVPCLCTELISSLCVFRPVKAASASGRSE